MYCVLVNLLFNKFINANLYLSYATIPSTSILFFPTFLPPIFTLISLVYIHLYPSHPNLSFSPKPSPPHPNPLLPSIFLSILLFIYICFLFTITHVHNYNKNTIFTLKLQHFTFFVFYSFFVLCPFAS